MRTTGCNLRCVWCDTPQAFHGGTRMTREDVLAQALALGTPLVELTGGEPLLQPGVFPLMRELCDAGKTVLVETSGEADVSRVDRRVHKVMDLKCPGSGESHRNRWSNLDHIGPRRRDQVRPRRPRRLRVDARRDPRARPRQRGRRTCSRARSSASSRPRDLVDWVLEDELPVRVQLQMHKYIWAPDATGV